MFNDNVACMLWSKGIRCKLKFALLEICKKMYRKEEEGKKKRGKDPFGTMYMLNHSPAEKLRVYNLGEMHLKNQPNHLFLVCGTESVYSAIVHRLKFMVAYSAARL